VECRAWSRNLENEEAKARYQAVKIQPQWVVTPGKQTNKQTGENCTARLNTIKCLITYAISETRLPSQNKASRQFRLLKMVQLVPDKEHGVSYKLWKIAGVTCHVVMLLLSPVEQFIQYKPRNNPVYSGRLIHKLKPSSEWNC